jgi:Nucleotidyl transferase AbiEii toxin, Type IV TA system
MRDDGESIRGRLRGVARARKTNTGFMLNRWAAERYLYRLSLSQYQDWLMLKGGFLFTVWEGDLHRTTEDIDLHAFDEQPLESTFAIVEAIAGRTVAPPDGVQFDQHRARCRALTGGWVPGVRVLIPAHIGTAEVIVRIDVGFGPIAAKPERRLYPTLLPGFEPCLLCCSPMTTMIAEKLAVAVEFGPDNTRLRDYYDLWYLSRRYVFLGYHLVNAIKAVFQTRDAGQTLQRDDGYWEAAYSNQIVNRVGEHTWREWIAEYAPHAQCPDLAATAEAVGRFALPLLVAARANRQMPARWSPDLGWVLEGSSTRSY